MAGQANLVRFPRVRMNAMGKGNVSVVNAFAKAVLMALIAPKKYARIIVQETVSAIQSA